MSLKKQFAVSNLTMLFLPMLIIGCISVVMLTLFLSKYLHAEITIEGSNINNIFELTSVVKNVFGTSPAVMHFAFHRCRIYDNNRYYTPFIQKYSDTDFKS